MMRTFLSVSILVLGALTLAASSGLRHPITDLLSNFHWHFFAAAVIAAVFASRLKLQRIGLLAVLVALCALWQTQRYDAALPASASEGGDYRSLKIMTFNVWGRAQDLDRLMDYVAKEDPDVVLIQELLASSFGKLGPLRARYPHMHYCRQHECYAAIISKLPWKKISSGKRFYDLPLVVADFGEKFGNLRLVHVHSYRPHLYYDTQHHQFMGLGKWLGAYDGPVVLGGDFNSTVFSAPLRLLAALAGLKHAGVYRATWPKRLPALGYVALPFLQLGLDQFFVSDDIQVLSTTLGEDLSSDHMPLLMEFSVKSTAASRSVENF